MTAIITLLLVAIVVSVGLFYPSWQRKQILRKPFPESWLDIVTRRLPFFDKLNPAEQNQLKGLIQLFLAKKLFLAAMA